MSGGGRLAYQKSLKEYLDGCYSYEPPKEKDRLANVISSFVTPNGTPNNLWQEVEDETLMEHPHYRGDRKKTIKLTQSNQSSIAVSPANWWEPDASVNEAEKRFVEAVASLGKKSPNASEEWNDIGLVRPAQVISKRPQRNEVRSWRRQPQQQPQPQPQPQPQNISPIRTSPQRPQQKKEWDDGSPKRHRSPPRLTSTKPINDDLYSDPPSAIPTHSHYNVYPGEGNVTYSQLYKMQKREDQLKHKQTPRYDAHRDELLSQLSRNRELIPSPKVDRYVSQAIPKDSSYTHSVSFADEDDVTLIEQNGNNNSPVNYILEDDDGGEELFNVDDQIQQEEKESPTPPPLSVPLSRIDDLTLLNALKRREDGEQYSSFIVDNEDEASISEIGMRARKQTIDCEAWIKAKPTMTFAKNPKKIVISGQNWQRSLNESYSKRQTVHSQLGLFTPNVSLASSTHSSHGHNKPTPSSIRNNQKSFTAEPLAGDAIRPQRSSARSASSSRQTKGVPGPWVGEAPLRWTQKPR